MVGVGCNSLHEARILPHSSGILLILAIDLHFSPKITRMSPHHLLKKTKEHWVYFH
jgi:hypothetical protein